MSNGLILPNGAGIVPPQINIPIPTLDQDLAQLAQGGNLPMAIAFQTARRVEAIQKRLEELVVAKAAEATDERG